MKGTLVPQNGGKSGTSRPRKRKRNNVLYGLFSVLGLIFFAENIAYLSSIHNDILATTMGDTSKPRVPQEKGGSAFCLLIKDDNDILPEWVAYHYHVFQMRRLIVAVDPDSKTSPLDVLQGWIENFDYFGLDVTIWNDEDYTPEFFYKTKDYSKLPNSVKKSVVLVNPSKKKQSDQLNDPILRTNWHTNKTYVKEHQEEVREEVIRINNHRFRQKNFVSECFRQVKKEHNISPFWRSKDFISWAVHIDTDEYLVPNPWIATYLRNETDTSASKHFRLKVLARIFPYTPSEGSLWKFFKEFFKHNKKSNEKTCVMMPRILFGSKEDPGNMTIATATTTLSEDYRANKLTWYHSKFETLRWKYHANFETEARPKSMINVDQLQETDGIFENKTAGSIHRPLSGRLGSNQNRNGCPAEPKTIYNDRRFAQPIAVYHYLGSLERYLSRADARRDERVYERNNRKGTYAKGDGNDVDKASGWWIGGWLNNFVAGHDGEMAYSVLPEPYATRQPLE